MTTAQARAFVLELSALNDAQTKRIHVLEAQLVTKENTAQVYLNRIITLQAELDEVGRIAEQLNAQLDAVLTNVSGA